MIKINTHYIRMPLALILGAQLGGLVSAHIGVIAGLIVGIVLTIVVYLLTKPINRHGSMRCSKWSYCNLFIFLLINTLIIYFSRYFKVWLIDTVWVDLWIPYTVLALFTLIIFVLIVLIIPYEVQDDVGSDKQIIMNYVNQQNNVLLEKISDLQKAIIEITKESHNNPESMPLLQESTEPDPVPTPTFIPLQKDPHMAFREEIVSLYKKGLNSHENWSGFRNLTKSIKLTNYDASNNCKVHEYCQTTMSTATLRLAQKDDKGFVFIDYERLSTAEPMIFDEENVEVFFIKPKEWSENGYLVVIEPAEVCLLPNNMLKITKPGKLS